MEMLNEVGSNFVHNLFQPLLLFFYMGFLIPLLRVPFEFPKVIYQGITIYLLVAIGWEGGERLAALPTEGFYQALGFMAIGFCINIVISLIAYKVLRTVTHLRKIDAATVGGYYGSDSAGTFVTCTAALGILAQIHADPVTKLADPTYSYESYMPVLLAVMETPGCLVALALIASLRRKGMDVNGNMPDEPGYQGMDSVALATAGAYEHAHGENGHGEHAADSGHGGTATQVAVRRKTTGGGHGGSEGHGDHGGHGGGHAGGMFSPKVLHEIFLNPGLYLLFGGIIVGFIGGQQGHDVTAPFNTVFHDLFKGILSLFLLEMGITACSRLRDLKAGGIGFIAFGLLMPNVFATIGILVAHGYSAVIGHEFAIGTYALFAVLCGASSYIAVPAVQRMAIPEASPTLPLAASLGLTFSWNVTMGIPIYIMIATLLKTYVPIAY